MPSTPKAPKPRSWFGRSEAPNQAQQEYVRLWHDFMNARLALSAVLLVLQGGLYLIGATQSLLIIGICSLYWAAAYATRKLLAPRPLGSAFNRAWIVTVGADIVVFCLLHILQTNNINYTPLFALPVLLASTLGSVRLALGTAATVTTFLLGATIWAHWQLPNLSPPSLVQSALTGVGYFAVALLASQLAKRLTLAGTQLRMSENAAALERQINELVIDSLSDGVLVVDAQGHVRAANPAARQLLDTHADNPDLHTETRWQPLLELTQSSLSSKQNRQQSITIHHERHGPRRMLARTRLTAPHSPEEEPLCVLFLQDQREVEARLRTEKIASLGRMSTAVAHEIRNPLAAIAQANALLAEDLNDPKFSRLTYMIEQNAKRLEKIVDDILDVARVPTTDDQQHPDALPLKAHVQRICTDWQIQRNGLRPVLSQLQSATAEVYFDPEHLRRVLVNLLDNAQRYASGHPQAIQVHSHLNTEQHPVLAVWSDGPPMDQSVERHLFEPFFSSESRSSGLGLFLCRELCARHGASIQYRRRNRQLDGQARSGNEFYIVFAHPQTPAIDTSFMP